MGFYELRPQFVEARQVVIGDAELAKWCYGSYGPGPQDPYILELASPKDVKQYLIFEANDGRTHYVGEGDWVLKFFFNGFLGMSNDEFTVSYREIERPGEVPNALSTMTGQEPKISSINLDTHIYDGYYHDH